MNAFGSRWLIAMIAVFGCADAYAAYATTYTVTSTSSGGTCVGDSTSDPDCTLDAAISAARNYDRILFAPAVQGHAISGYGFGLTYDITIDAFPGGVTIDGGGAGNIFSILGGVNVTLRGLTIQNGLGNNSGGAIYNFDSNVVLDSCTFASNNATQSGGAILNLSTLLVYNSTFVGNHAGYTSGAVYAGGSTTVVSSTFTGNSAGNNSGAMLVSGTLTLLSSIIAGNSAPSGPDVSSVVGLVSLGHNLLGDSTNSGWNAQTGDQLDVDPLFAPALLADNGGPTQTVALQPDSLARSGGDCSGHASSPSIAPVSVDQRGVTRSSPCTIGAFDMTSIFYGTFEAR